MQHPPLGDENLYFRWAKDRAPSGSWSSLVPLVAAPVTLGECEELFDTAFDATGDWALDMHR
jgi:hypothetical protein